MCVCIYIYFKDPGFFHSCFFLRLIPSGEGKGAGEKDHRWLPVTTKVTARERVNFPVKEDPSQKSPAFLLLLKGLNWVTHPFLNHGLNLRLLSPPPLPPPGGKEVSPLKQGDCVEKGRPSEHMEALLETKGAGAGG